MGLSGDDVKRSGHPAVDFINGLKHTGDFIGEPFALRLWQEAIVRRIFDEKGKARYRRVFIALPRKQGKTELIAAIKLFLMGGTGKRGQRIYSASGDREQAALIYGAAASMVRQSPSLSSVFLTYDGYKRIVCEPLDGIYQALSSDAPRKHGLRPSTILLDELHVFPNRELYNVLHTAFGATRDPLEIAITTAGYDRTSLCWEQWQYARGVRDGLIDDPTFLPILYEADPEDDWTSEEVWRKAMPALGDFCQLDFIREECRRAQELPAYENTFRQLYLNQWTEQATRWLSTQQWADCGERVDPASLVGRPCYGGLDLGVTGDMSVYVMVFPDGEGGYDVLAHGWAPRDGKWRQEQRNRDRYLLWEKQGYLTFTPGEVTDHQAIEDMVVEWAEKYPLRQLNADRAYATQLLTRLYNEHGLNVKGIPQGPLTMNEPMVRLEELIVEGKIRHGNNPILAWNVANAVVHRNRTGLMELDKAQATERIDGLSALLNALAAAVADPADHGPSVYESRGLLLI
jgi:phage terminase large subunit-like protein